MPHAWSLDILSNLQEGHGRYPGVNGVNLRKIGPDLGGLSKEIRVHRKPVIAL